MRICSGAGCLRTVPDSVRMCDECGGGKQSIRTHSTSDRDAYRKLYAGPRWRSLSKVVLRRHPICVRCKKACSDLADHRVPAGEAIRQAAASGRYPYNPYAGFYILSNLDGLCRSCHAYKTNEDKAHVGHWPSVLSIEKRSNSEQTDLIPLE